MTPLLIPGFLVDYGLSAYVVGLYAAQAAGHK